VYAYDGTGRECPVTAYWHEATGTLLVRHENLPGGLTVAVEWGGAPAANF